MISDKALLRRVRLIERMRIAEKQAAAAEAQRAEMVRQKLETLCLRTRSLAEVYATRDRAVDAADLRTASIMGLHLRQLGRNAEQQAEQARLTADARLLDLANAERRRVRAEENHKSAHRAVSERQEKTHSVPVRKTGTHLE